ncbi:hypothetical protein H8N01_31140 [Streptomyces sp. AC536]|nr:hypothetical protein [Streptomyces buecherae]QNJ43251.1 hypothetical protein H7H31_28865 [Streptomyces buecherae]
MICDATGIPLAVTLTGGNRKDVTQLIPLLAAIPRIRSTPGRPRQRPKEVCVTVRSGLAQARV